MFKSFSKIPLAITIVDQTNHKQIKLKIKTRINEIEKNILSHLIKKKFNFPNGSTVLNVAIICKRNKIVEMFYNFASWILFDLCYILINGQYFKIRFYF